MRNGGVFKGLHLQNKVVKRIDEEKGRPILSFGENMG